MPSVLNFDRLPSFTFFGPNGAKLSISLGSQRQKIRSVAYSLRQRCAPGSVIGLMFPSEPDLVVAWLACVLAGLRPLILQYPNKKQNRSYWGDWSAIPSNWSDWKPY